jgi:methionyl-tRNA synthetase
METVLAVTADVVRQIAILTQPVMPQSSNRLLDLLSVPKNSRSFASLGEKGRLGHGWSLQVDIPSPVAIFPRYVDPDTEGGTEAKAKPGKKGKPKKT